MSEATAIPASFLDQAVAFGNTSLNFVEQYSKLSLDTLKQFADGQIEFGNAIAELTASQFKSLSETTNPQDLLQRQKGAYEEFGAKAQSYLEHVRSTAQEVQQAYAALGQEFAGALSKGLKPSA